MLRVLTVLAQSLLARAHKSYPSIERVAKSLTPFSSPDEVEELLGNFNVTPAVPVRGFLYTTMLASKGLGPHYPTNHEKKTAATPGQVKNTLNWWNVVSGGLHTCAVHSRFKRRRGWLTSPSVTSLIWINLIVGNRCAFQPGPIIYDAGASIRTDNCSCRDS